jgi:lipopolysaccharide transport system ATP-binding protein
MDAPIIEIKNLGKRYNIAHQRGGYVALRDVLAYIIRRPFRFLSEKAKQAVGAQGKEEFWALKDISLTVQRGEIIGVIGRNGAGKSTLLKILTGITPPTEGEAILRGRVSSLLEVGTGFHPELTGRENIFLNGAILGMARREIARKFDEIVAFAGVAQFIDTPVKYYSSGMYVRLAFSVAAHMEPDILIIDEVLAVGDAEFQKKCLGKMEEVTKEQGRTILFVSHNLAAIQTLCTKTVLLEGGRISMFGRTEDVIEHYSTKSSTLAAIELGKRLDRKGTQRVMFTECETKITGSRLPTLHVRMKYVNRTSQTFENAKISLDIFNSREVHVADITNTVLDQKLTLAPGEGIIEAEIRNINLGSEQYRLNLFLATDDMNTEILDWISDVQDFRIDNSMFYPTKRQPPITSTLLLDFSFSQKQPRI